MCDSSSISYKVRDTSKITLGKLEKLIEQKIEREHRGSGGGKSHFMPQELK